MPTVQLLPNRDGTYDLVLNYTANDWEAAEEFDVKGTLRAQAGKLSQVVSSYAKKVTIRSVKIMVSGILVATLAFSAFWSVFAASDRYTMGYLYAGTDHQQIEYVNQTNNALDVVSPSYFDIRQDGSLKLNYLSAYFIKSMHDKGIRVVPFLSNHWNRTAGINALKNVESLASQIAEYVDEYDLDGVNVDIENVTHEQRDQYTELVRLLREKIPAEKEISVAVAANPNNWQVGWHGSYDYAALAKYADHLVIMAYDEHYEGSEAGPVASIDFVEKSIQYALSQTTADKIVVGVPFYGRVWSLDNDRIVGKGASTKTIQQILENCEATVTYDEDSQSVKAEFTVTSTSGQFTVGGDVVLQPGRYVAWFENDKSYQAKLNLIEKYDLKGAGAWSLGQEDTSIWDHYEGWVNGSQQEAGPEEGTTTTTEASSTTAPSTSTTTGASSSTAPSASTTTGTSSSTVSPSTSTTTGASSSAAPSASTTTGASSTAAPSASTTTGASSSAAAPSSTATGAGSSTSSTTTKAGNTTTTTAGGSASSPTTPAPDTEGETAPDTSAPLPDGWVLYEIQRGDTLWGIAKRFLGSGTRYPEIMALNGLTSDLIYAGDHLKIPEASNGENAYRQYTVKRGDSLWRIAKTQLGSGLRYTEIMQLNGLTGDLIHPGQVLKLPE